jgi:glycosyltransferase involved in cell wall biosynthesis
MLLENNPYPADVRVRNEARSLVGAGYEVKVIAPRAPAQPRSERIDGVTVSRYTLPGLPATAGGYVGEYLIANVQLLARAMVELARGAAVLHIHNPPDTLFPAAVAARRLGRRVVYDHHDLAPELYRVKFGGSRMALALQWFERASLRCADVVLAPNQSHRRIATERGGVDPRRVHVVRNGPRRAEIVSGVDPRRGSLVDPRLIFVGSMECQDGVEQLPELVEALVRHHRLPGTHLTIVGDGSMRRSVQERFVTLRLSQSVTFTGRVHHDAVRRLIADADIGIDPAPPNPLNDRSTMIKVLEYMAAGKPVVAYGLDETRASVNGAARFAETSAGAALAQEVAVFAEDESLRREMGERGRVRVTQLTWEHSEVELLRAYAGLGGSGQTH